MSNNDNFNSFCDKYFIPTSDNSSISRCDMHRQYEKWYYTSSENANGIGIPDKGTTLFKKGRYNTRKIGKPEFYKLLVDKYGEAPLKARRTKQLYYRLTSIYMVEN
jgi:hypothetical protein